MDNVDKVLALIAGKIEALMDEALDDALPFILVVPADKIRVVSNMPKGMVTNIIAVMNETGTSKPISFDIDDVEGIVNVGGAGIPVH